jgi:flagellar biosynthesis protein FliQ
MDTSSVIDLAREAMWVTILVSAPLLAVVLVIGVVINREAWAWWHEPQS